jgi:hypothetical protein
MALTWRAETPPAALPHAFRMYVSTEATCSSVSRPAIAGMAGAVGANFVPPLLDPSTTTRMRVVASSDCTIVLPASLGNRCSAPTQSRHGRPRKCRCKSPDPRPCVCHPRKGPRGSYGGWLHTFEIRCYRTQILIGHVFTGILDLLRHRTLQSGQSPVEVGHHSDEPHPGRSNRQLQ